MTIDEKLALLRTHRNNIGRYVRLLKTELTEFERRFIEKRVMEERAAVQALAASTFPVSFGFPKSAIEEASLANGRHDVSDAQRSQRAN